MRKLPFVQLDVFTHKPLEGNQLAVFTDARGLSEDEMQALARETNFSETTFIVPRDAAVEATEGVRVRIFTVAEELPFAGHPTLGTASLIHRARGAREVVLALGVGKIAVSFEARTEGLFGTMRQRDPEFGARHAAHDVAPLGGLSPADLRDDIPIQTVSTGLPFLVVPVRSLAALQALRAGGPAVERYLATAGATGIYWFCTETGSADVDVRSRMIFYGGEDPATGSATGCCISHLVANRIFTSSQWVRFDQGVEMKRPSRLYARASLADAEVTSVEVGGFVVEVARGEYVLP